jgi:hypothetical protein
MERDEVPRPATTNAQRRLTITYKKVDPLRHTPHTTQKGGQFSKGNRSAKLRRVYIDPKKGGLNLACLLLGTAGGEKCEM